MEVEGVEVQSDLLAEVEVEVQGVEVQSDPLAEVEVEVEGVEFCWWRSRWWRFCWCSRATTEPHQGLAGFGGTCPVCLSPWWGLLRGSGGGG